MTKHLIPAGRTKRIGLSRVGPTLAAARATGDGFVLKSRRPGGVAEGQEVGRRKVQMFGAKRSRKKVTLAPVTLKE